tara:strand:+ start:5126 stop:6205 length:1080 start_codon:yes stop_codon:yes gene_type:complete
MNKINIVIYSTKSDIYYKHDFNKNSYLNLKNDYKKNQSFDLSNHDNLFLSKLIYDLRKVANFRSYYEESNKDIDLLIAFNQIPVNILNNAKFKSKKKYLIIGEPKSVLEKSYKKNYLKNFDKVFTFQENLVDNKKIFFMRLNFTVSENFKKIKSKKKFLSVMFATYRPYTKRFKFRMKTISWYNKYNPANFNLYGMYWYNANIDVFKKNLFLKIYSRIINKIFYLLKITNTSVTKVYKGYSENQILTGSKYFFQHCYENDINWISSRIFQCFFSNSVPVYSGYQKITKQIPKNCYLLKSDFKNNEECDQYLLKLSKDKKRYNKYLKNINNFLKSKKSRKFFIENDIKFLINIIKKEFRI